MSLLTKIIIGAAGAGLVIGGVVGVLSAPDSAAGTLARDAVPVYLCPGEGEVGSLHRGDRVLVTGRSGDWLAVRNVRGAGERVFVAAAAIVPDADLSGLPEVDCDDAGSIAFGEITTTTVDESTTTTSPPTTTLPSTTTTPPPPAQPSVSQVSSAPAEIWEYYVENEDSCGPASTSDVSAAVTAPAGAQSVVMTWSSSLGSGGPLSMQGQAGIYTAVLGIFDAAASPNVPFGQSVTVTVTVTVTDSLGRQASGNTTLTLHGC